MATVIGRSMRISRRLRAPGLHRREEIEFMTQRRLVLVIAAFAVAALGSLSAPLSAHHGGAAFDQARKLAFEGTVTELQFANPHVLVYFDVKNKDGAVESWSGWLTAPNKLARAGWTKRTLAPGDHITISGTPHKGGNRILQIRTLAGPDGKALPLSEN
jgi:hypothetical protein